MTKKHSLATTALVALAAAGGAVAASTTDAYAQSTPTIQGMSGAPEIRDGEQRFKIRGRFQYDIMSNDWDILAEDGTRSYVRRAFIGAQGRFSNRWRYKIDFVLNPGANDSTGTPATGGGDDVAVDDAYLEYAGDFFSFVIGENNVTSPLEDRTSSLDIPFIERSSFINTFGYGRAAGAAFLVTGANWMGSAGVYGDSLNNQDNNFALDEQFSVSGRFTWAPIFEVSPESYYLVHLGVSGRYRYQGDDAAFRYRTRPLNGRGTRWIDAGGALAGERDTTYGVEFAAQFNQFGLTAEYSMLEGEETPAAGGSDFEFEGYYVDASWSLTGEPRAYRGNQGAFGPIAPRHPVTEGGIGHWSLSARYDYVDLSDPAAAAGTRGEQTAYAIGLDWVPVDHVRLKLNYASSDMDRTGPGTVDDEAQVITLRTQFDF
ncbi:MAG: OprO/OprP family phosphate-selective porin [Hyphomonadaceae bacterium]